MVTKKKRLGRGLDALLSQSSARAREAGDQQTAGGSDALREIPVDLLQRGRYQPRSDMRQDSLEELADSIRAQGVVQPIVVRPVGPAGGEARYEIVAGERRWRAAQLAGLAEIPAVVRQIPDEAAVAMALIENIQREDLNPLEEALALSRLIAEFDMTHQQAAEAVRETLEGTGVELKIIRMDTKRNPSVENLHLLKQLYALRYKNKTFDAITCSDDNAFQFLLSYGDSLFSHTPIVFCGVNFFNDSFLVFSMLCAKYVEPYPVASGRIFEPPQDRPFPVSTPVNSLRIRLYCPYKKPISRPPTPISPTPFLMMLLLM